MGKMILASRGDATSGDKRSRGRARVTSRIPKAVLQQAAKAHEE
jgi:hypothetical protein